MKIWVTVLIAGLLGLATPERAPCKRIDGGKAVASGDVRSDPRWPPAVVGLRPLMVRGGGRVDWCHADNLIAYDSVKLDGSSEVYVIKPDGTGRRCVTCETPGLPKGIRGQPAWHPSCDFMVIQVQNQHYKGSRFEFVSFGIHNDLWLVAADGRWAERLLAVAELGAALHPHFSGTGDRLFWTTRESTGTTIPRLQNLTPGGENPWDGWFLSVADFSRDKKGPARLAHRTNLYRGEGGFFESHALEHGKIWFSHTPQGRPFVESIFRADMNGSNRIGLHPAGGRWNEHVEPSTNGKIITFNSSRGFPWKHPPDLAITLRMELWAGKNGEEPVQLTHFNEKAGPGWRIIASDYAWGPSGRKIATYHMDIGPGGEIRQGIAILTLGDVY